MRCQILFGSHFVLCHSLIKGSQRSVLWASLNFLNNDFLAKLNEPQYNNQIDFLQTSLMEYQKNICYVIEVKKKKRHPKVFKFALVLVSNYFNSNQILDSWPWPKLCSVLFCSEFPLTLWPLWWLAVSLAFNFWLTVCHCYPS